MLPHFRHIADISSIGLVMSAQTPDAQ